MENTHQEINHTVQVSVIIPHLRGDEYLLPLLEDLKRERNSSVELDVLLVDNASSDGSTQRALREHPWIRVLHLPSNHGYAGGCNRGIEETDSRWVLLLNDDVRLEPDSLKLMLEVAESAEDIAAVQPKILSMTAPGSFDYAGGAGGLIDRFGYPFALGRIGGFLEKDQQQYDSSIEIFWASGTACLWRRATLKQIGMLDESFFAHMEEIDLAWRAWNSGWRIYSAPKAVVHHFGGATLSYRAWRKMFLNHRNSLIALAKNASLWHLLYALPLRFFLDNSIGIAEIFSGRLSRLPAVWVGWADFFRLAPHWLAKRKVIQKQRVKSEKELRSVIYGGCILLAYFSGVRSAGDLAVGQK